MSRIKLCKPCVWGGLLVSAALHLGVAATLLQIETPSLPEGPEDEDMRPLGLDLAMFVDSAPANVAEASSAEPSTPFANPLPAITSAATPVAPDPIAQPPAVASQAPVPPTPAPPAPRAPAPDESTPPPSPTPAPAAEPARLETGNTAPETAKPAEPTHLGSPAKPTPKPRQSAETAAPTKRAAAPPKPAPVKQAAPPKVIKPKTAKPASSRPTTSRQVRASAERRPEGRAARRDGSAGSRVASSDSGGGSGGNRGADENAYLAALQRAIGHHQRYPERSRRWGETGTAIVSFTILADGRLTRIRLGKSSGYSALDQAALDAMHRLARFKPIPRSIGKSTWALRVPIRFALE